jgi:hypothetical protein
MHPEANPLSLLHRTLDPEARELLTLLRVCAPRLARLIAGDCIADCQHSKDAMFELDRLLQRFARGGSDGR